MTILEAFAVQIGQTIQTPDGAGIVKHIQYTAKNGQTNRILFTVNGEIYSHSKCSFHKNWTSG